MTTKLKLSLPAPPSSSLWSPAFNIPGQKQCLQPLTYNFPPTHPEPLAESEAKPARPTTHTLTFEMQNPNRRESVWRFLLLPYLRQLLDPQDPHPQNLHAQYASPYPLPVFSLPYFTSLRELNQISSRCICGEKMGFAKKEKFLKIVPTLSLSGWKAPLLKIKKSLSKEDLRQIKGVAWFVS